MPRRISPIRSLYAEAASGRAAAAPEAPAQLAEGEGRQAALDPAQELWLSSRIGGLLRARFGAAWSRDRSLQNYAARVAQDALTGTGSMLQKLSTDARRYSRNSASLAAALDAKFGPLA